MTGSILNRLIFAELLKVFVLSLTVLTGLLVTGGMAQMAMQMGLSIGQVFRAIPLFIPNTLPYTIPTTTLFATCVVYGRLSHDNEVVAIRAAGVHLVMILKPALLLGVMAAGITGGLYHTIIPRSQQLLYQQVVENPEDLLYNMLRRDRCIRHPNMAYALYVRDLQGRRLIDVVLKKRSSVKDPQTGQVTFVGYEMVARAREAQLRVDQAEGKLYVDPDRFVIYDKTTAGASGSNGPFPMDLPEGLNGKDAKVRVSAITSDEMPDKIAALEEDVEAAEKRREGNRKAAEAQRNPYDRQLFLEQDVHYKMQVENAQRMLRNVLDEYHRRPATAFGCILFALVGCPVGIWANRADYLSTFVICFIPVVCLYYPFTFAGSDMAKNGRISLQLGAWLANIVFAVIAVALNARLLRR
jgi:lipopolysaccharide export system permease protein